MVNGSPMEERANGSVTVPFGTEYSIRLRNKHQRRALAKITIDGENISSAGFIIPARTHIDILRPADKDAAFKFVDIDSPDAIDFGKNGPNDNKVKGTIKVEFFLEKEPNQQYIPYTPYIKEIHHHHYDYNFGYNKLCDNNLGSSSFNNTPISSPFGSSTPISNQISSSIAPMRRLRSSTGPLKAPAAQIKDGCTVEGVSTGQRFSQSYIDIDEATSTIITLFMQGYVEPIKKPVQVNTNLTDLEKENEELRDKIAKLENAKLKRKLRSLAKKS